MTQVFRLNLGGGEIAEMVSKSDYDKLYLRFVAEQALAKSQALELTLYKKAVKSAIKQIRLINEMNMRNLKMVSNAKKWLARWGE